MHPVLFFDTINIETPCDKIYRRLGYRKGITSIEPRQAKEVEASISSARSLIKLRGAALRLPIGEKKDSRIILSGVSEPFRSRRLAGFLRGCDETLLMAATAGGEIMAAIEEAAGDGRLTKGVVFDAAASEMVDAALDWLMSYFARELRRENKALTKRRFSAGYGDFLLENQGTIFRMLELERIGVRITESFVLVPEKSVTAIAGVLGARSDLTTEIRSCTQNTERKKSLL